ncbi:MAG TPA: hypothetical protein VEY07_03455 [Thermoplasmata archaeon]|nr:hypothetical protein [Thermoplasmata archaeon]
MTGVPEVDGPAKSPSTADWLGPLLWALPGAGLAITSTVGVIAGILILAAGVLAAVLLSNPRYRLGAAVPALPGIVILGILASTSPVGPISEAAAGAAGLLVVLALARAAAEPARRGSVTPALLVPALGVGIAFTTALVFATSERFVGLATLLLLGVIVAVALVLRRPASVLDAEGGTS